MPTPTVLPNPNSGIDLLRLQSGRLLLAFNNSKTVRTPLNVALAEEDESWGWIQTIEDEPGEFSYPTLVQSDEGQIHMAYTYQREHIQHACFTEAWLRKGKIQ
jgi:predicted neuraminidase